MNVLSLFDGMSCGLVALKKMGIKVDRYFASEIDPWAIKVSQKNHPEITHIGSVTDVRYEDGVLYWTGGQERVKIDMLIGGFPCPDFSFAGKQAGFNGKSGVLFFDCIRLLSACKPSVFFFENVVMKKDYQDVISQYIGVQPIKIDSALVSAQTRKRLYWTNIPNVTQPLDRGIMLMDILEEPGLGARVIDLRLNEKGIRRDYDPGVAATQRLVLNEDPLKSNCLSTVSKDNVVIPVIQNRGQLYVRLKSMCLDANYHKGPDNHGQRTVILLGYAKDIKGHDYNRRAYSPEGKAPSLTAASGGNLEPKVALSDFEWRKLSPVECERLQGLPDEYTAGVSNTQRYKMLGNGWQVDTIIHIFTHHFLKDIL